MVPLVEKSAARLLRRLGASLFYELGEEGRTAIGAGTLDSPSGLKTMRHIYVADKGDYYSIADHIPQFKAGS